MMELVTNREEVESLWDPAPPIGTTTYPFLESYSKEFFSSADIILDNGIYLPFVKTKGNKAFAIRVEGMNGYIGFDCVPELKDRTISKTLRYNRLYIHLPLSKLFMQFSKIYFIPRNRVMEKVRAHWANKFSSYIKKPRWIDDLRDDWFPPRGICLTSGSRRTRRENPPSHLT